MAPDIANNLKMAVLEQDRAEVNVPTVHQGDLGLGFIAYMSPQLQHTIDLLREELATRDDDKEKLAELVKEKNILEDLVVSTQA